MIDGGANNYTLPCTLHITVDYRRFEETSFSLFPICHKALPMCPIPEPWIDNVTRADMANLTVIGSGMPS